MDLESILMYTGMIVNTEKTSRGIFGYLQSFPDGEKGLDTSVYLPSANILWGETIKKAILEDGETLVIHMTDTGKFLKIDVSSNRH
jgi:hypothetical protein